MALVPFRVSGRAGHDLDERLLEIGPHTIILHQEPESSGSSRMEARRNLSNSLAEVEDVELPSRPREGTGCQMSPLGNVGKVVWQSGFLLATLLIQHPPLGNWEGVRVVDLGTGTGVVGIALAKAGAAVLLTDLPHIIPLAAKNAARNDLGPPYCQVVEHIWGECTKPLEPCPDVITGGDLIYGDAESHTALLSTLDGLCGPHTLVYLAHRSRGEKGKGFAERLSENGFFVREVPRDMYHYEYQDQSTPGTYHILQAMKLP